MAPEMKGAATHSTSNASDPGFSIASGAETASFPTSASLSNSACSTLVTHATEPSTSKQHTDDMQDMTEACAPEDTIEVHDIGELDHNSLNIIGSEQEHSIKDKITDPDICT